MTPYDKEKFDKLTNTSYLFRVIFGNAGFDLSYVHIGDNEIWHAYYGETIIGTITTRQADTDDDKVTYTNLRLYKYFRDKFPELEDFVMSKYFDVEDGKRVRFDFDKFEKYIGTILEVFKDKIQHHDKDDSVKEANSVEDAIARLKEYCDEFDEKFSNNIMFKDIRLLLDENERLTKELAVKSDKIMKLFLNN